MTYVTRLIASVADRPRHSFNRTTSTTMNKARNEQVDALGRPSSVFFLFVRALSVERGERHHSLPPKYMSSRSSWGIGRSSVLIMSYNVLNAFPAASKSPQATSGPLRPLPNHYSLCDPPSPFRTLPILLNKRGTGNGSGS